MAACYWGPEATHAANIVINNLDPAGTGFNDPTPWTPTGGNSATTLGQARLNAFQYAAGYWGKYLYSTVTITIDANFTNLTPCNAFVGVLGSAGANTVHMDFASVAPYPQPVSGTWYPQALANAMSGTDLAPGSSDIIARFNANIGTSGCLSSYTWYYGLDGNAPFGTIDLVTILLHEFAHGLGFQTFENVSSGALLSGSPDTFLRSLEFHGVTPSDFVSMTDGQRAAANIGDPNLHWIGANVLAEAAVIPLTSGVTNGHVRMYGPNPLQPGSSVSHYHSVLTPNELMEPAYTGPDRDLRLTLALLQDVGWQIIRPTLTITNLKNGSVRLSWTGSGTLQQKSSLPGGAWSDVAGNPSSPYTTGVTNSQTYFRVRF
jgi:hypothetical protein